MSNQILVLIVFLGIGLLWGQPTSVDAHPEVAEGVN